MSCFYWPYCFLLTVPPVSDLRYPICVIRSAFPVLATLLIRPAICKGSLRRPLEEQKQTVVMVDRLILRRSTMTCWRSKAFSARSSDRIRARSRAAPIAKFAPERAGRNRRWTARPRATSRAATEFKCMGLRDLPMTVRQQMELISPVAVKILHTSAKPRAGWSLAPATR